jgi:4-hydroxybenzoate polyprenyltransferase
MAAADSLYGRQRDSGIPQTPLVVDMDGALLRTDTLFEGLVSGLARRPLATLAAMTQLARGRARLKSALNAVGEIDVESLPIREDLIDYLKAEHAKGRPIHLVTAADQLIADRVSARIGLFDSAQGSDGRVNLKGARKLAVLKTRFPDGFTYAGDSVADLSVWAGAAGVVLVGVNPRVAARARSLGKPVEAAFLDSDRSFSSDIKAWGKLLRLHQWAKNLLLFAPLFLAHLSLSPRAWAVTISAFFVVGLVASGTYILNDLADLSADRRHATKRDRPLASGRVPIQTAIVLAPLLILAGLTSAIAIGAGFAAVLAGYLATTLSYSLLFKRTPMLDVFLLGGLYTLRIVMGTIALGVAFSPWLLTFSFFFFFSLSVAKRQVEIVKAPGIEGSIRGRGYRKSDAPLILAFGVASTVASLLILVLYLMEEAFPSGTYPSPQWLWAAPLLTGLWTLRIWLLAHRGELDDDPVIFAVRDRVSIGLAVVLGAAFLASLFD